MEVSQKKERWKDYGNNDDYLDCRRYGSTGSRSEQKDWNGQIRKHTIEKAHSINKQKRERITIMKTMINNIKRMINNVACSYKSAMNMYGEALMKGCGYGCA